MKQNSTDTSGGTQGETLPQQGPATTDKGVGRLPHERDESAGAQESSEPSAQRLGDTGRKDVESGRVDTDKGPVMDQTYDRVREGTPDPEKKFSP